MRWLSCLALVIALAPARARAFARTTDGDGGACLFWSSRSIGYRINDAGVSNLPFSQVQSSIEAGFSAWMGWACSDFSYRDDGPTANAMVGYDRVLVAQPDLAGEVDNSHLVVFRETSCSDVAPPDDDCWDPQNDDCDNKYGCWLADISSGDALAFTLVTSEISTGQILDADTAFDAFDFEFQDLAATGCDSRVDPEHCADLQNTMAHEAGHFLGLAHSDDSNATMYFSVTGLDETSKRDLDADDVNGLCAIYPVNAPTVTCVPQPEHTVYSRGCGCGSADALSLWTLLVPLLVAKRRRLH